MRFACFGVSHEALKGHKVNGRFQKSQPYDLLKPRPFLQKVGTNGIEVLGKPSKATKETDGCNEQNHTCQSATACGCGRFINEIENIFVPSAAFVGKLCGQKKSAAEGIMVLAPESQLIKQVMLT